MNSRVVVIERTGFLDQVRGIAQRGINYAQDPYDVARYTELLNLAAIGYERYTSVPPGELLERFAREMGYITPKVGVDAAIFHADGERLLLIRRADSGLWALPGGWAEIGMTVQDSIAKEVREEVSLTVRPGEVIAVNTSAAALSGSPHSSVHILFHCLRVGGSIQETPEAVEVGYHDISTIGHWHDAHGVWAAQAIAWHMGRSI